jgi:hypothetical protein
MYCIVGFERRNVIAIAMVCGEYFSPIAGNFEMHLYL